MQTYFKVWFQRCLILFFLCCSDSLLETEGAKLVIDHDGGADDAMAIFMALIHEKYFHGPKVVGITTVHGNVNESQVFENTQRILDIAKRQDVPIHRGSSNSLVLGLASDYYFGLDGLGDQDNVSYVPIREHPMHAVLALIELSKRYHGDLIVVSIGSLTNIAMAIKLDPEFLSRLSQLYVGAGNINDANHTEGEFNALMDVEGYHIVADNAIEEKVTLVPFSPIIDSFTGVVSREWREHELGTIQTEIMRNLNIFEQISIVQSEEWQLLDPAVMAIVLNETMADVTLTENSIYLCGAERGVNINNLTSPSNPNAKVVYRAYPELYKQFLIDLFSAELN